MLHLSLYSFSYYDTHYRPLLPPPPREVSLERRKGITAIPSRQLPSEKQAYHSAPGLTLSVPCQGPFSSACDRYPPWFATSRPTDFSDFVPYSYPLLIGARPRSSCSTRKKEYLDLFSDSLLNTSTITAPIPRRSSLLLPVESPQGREPRSFPFSFPSLHTFSTLLPFQRSAFRSSFSRPERF